MGQDTGVLCLEAGEEKSLAGRGTNPWEHAVKSEAQGEVGRTHSHTSLCSRLPDSEVAVGARPTSQRGARRKSMQPSSRPPRPHLSSSWSLIHPKLQEHPSPLLKTPPPLPHAGPLQPDRLAAGPLCFLPVPITFCSLLPSLNYDKPGPSFISVS